jgi:hypothetical protein
LQFEQLGQIHVAVRNRLLSRVDTAPGPISSGIEAQRKAVARFTEAERITVIGEFTEVETGKGNDALDRRPQLAVALAAARQRSRSSLPSSTDCRATSRSSRA